MSIAQLISQSIPVLSPDDTICRALEILNDNKISGLAVVSDDDYLGLVTESGLDEIQDDSVTILESGLLAFKPAISAQAHPLEAFSIMQQAHLPVLPVTDTDHKYAGSVSRDSLVGYIAEKSGIANPGGILVLEMLPRNYSLFEIARICENEDVILLAMHSHTNERGMLEITMKLNRTVLDAVVSSFERHDYHVLEVYGKETNNEDIIGKYNLLMNYINM